MHRVDILLLFSIQNSWPTLVLIQRENLSVKSKAIQAKVETDCDQNESSVSENMSNSMEQDSAEVLGGTSSSANATTDYEELDASEILDRLQVSKGMLAFLVC